VISQFLTLTASSTTATAHCRPRITYYATFNFNYCTSIIAVLFVSFNN